MKKLLLSFLLLLTLSACGETKYNITLQDGDDIVYKSETWIDKGCYIEIKGQDYEMTRDQDIDYSTFEAQTITYSYTHKETEYICKRVVLVLDEVDYNITVSPSIDTITLNERHIDNGLIFHNSDEDHFTVVVTGKVDSTIAGTYTLTYTIYGEDGRYLVLHRVVTVLS